MITIVCKTYELSHHKGLSRVSPSLANIVNSGAQFNILTSYCRHRNLPVLGRKGQSWRILSTFVAAFSRKPCIGSISARSSAKQNLFWYAITMPCSLQRLEARIEGNVQPRCACLSLTWQRTSFFTISLLLLNAERRYETGCLASKWQPVWKCNYQCSNFYQIYQLRQYGFIDWVWKKTQGWDAWHSWYVLPFPTKNFWVAQECLCKLATIR